jgi:hypothetical protein
MEGIARCRREGTRYLSYVNSHSPEIGKNRQTPIHPDVCPNLPVEKRTLDELPLETVILRYPDCTFLSLILEVLILQPIHHKRPLFLGQKRRGFGEVVERKVRNDCHDDRQDTLKNENPSPSSQISYTVHVRNSIREQSRERTGNTRRTEEQRLSELRFVSGIPHGDVICHTRKQAYIYQY